MFGSERPVTLTSRRPDCLTASAAPGTAGAAIRHQLPAGVRVVGLSDHTVSHSLYILDPDGNANGYADRDADGNANRDADRDADSDADSDANSDADSHADSHTDSDADTDTTPSFDCKGKAVPEPPFDARNLSNSVTSEDIAIDNKGYIIGSDRAASGSSASVSDVRGPSICPWTTYTSRSPSLS